jgi:hypothetical protein
MNKYIILVLLISATFVVESCNKDEMIAPEPKFEMFILDSLSNEVMITDQVPMGQDVYFRNTGNGNAYVIWFGERLLSRGFGSYELTQDALNQLVSLKEITSTAADALASIVGVRYVSDRDFKKALGKQLSADELKIFESNILNACVIPLKDINGKDSVLFRYNYSYDDFLNANEKGYYNVSGLSLDKNADNDFAAQYKFSAPGKRNVTFQAVGIGDFGSSTEISTISKEIEVINITE